MPKLDDQRTSPAARRLERQGGDHRRLAHPPFARKEQEASVEEGCGIQERHERRGRTPNPGETQGGRRAEVEAIGASLRA